MSKKWILFTLLIIPVLAGNQSFAVDERQDSFEVYISEEFTIAPVYLSSPLQQQASFEKGNYLFILESRSECIVKLYPTPGKKENTQTTPLAIFQGQCISLAKQAKAPSVEVLQEKKKKSIVILLKIPDPVHRTTELIMILLEKKNFQEKKKDTPQKRHHQPRADEKKKTSPDHDRWLD